MRLDTRLLAPAAALALLGFGSLAFAQSGQQTPPANESDSSAPDEGDAPDANETAPDNHAAPAPEEAPAPQPQG